MTQQQSIAKGDARQKWGGASFILGGILFTAGGLLMPHASNLTSDLQLMLKPLGEHASLTILASLLTAAGFWAVLMGLLRVYHSITSNGTGWARLGFDFVLIGTVLWTVSLSLDVAAASAIADWLGAPTAGKDAAWIVVTSLSALGRGMVPMTWIVYWLGLALLNAAMILSGFYTRWLGWTGLAVSIAVISLGVIQVFTPRSITLTLIFSSLMLLTTLWYLTMGILIARKPR